MTEPQTNTLTGDTMKPVKSVVKIRRDLAVEFESLPSASLKSKKVWTKEADEMIRRFWLVKDREMFIKVFSKNIFPVSAGTLRKRAKELRAMA